MYFELDTKLNVSISFWKTVQNIQLLRIAVKYSTKNTLIMCKFKSCEILNKESNEPKTKLAKLQF